MTYQGLGGTLSDTAMQFSQIFEILHTMALIHDDIIDNSAQRHGVSTLHHHIAHQYPHKAHNITEAQGILIGDLLLSWVYELLHSSWGFPHIAEGQKHIHTMIQEVIMGQMIDVDLML